MLNIIHEDADLLVVNKPADLVCHPTKNGDLSSLIGRARLHLNNQDAGASDQAPPGSRPCLVNRLDRETSGIVLIAKNSAIAGELGKIFESRGIQKEYLAIVHGHLAADHGVIDAPLGKDQNSLVAVKDCVRPDGVAAQTEYFVERRFTVGDHASACCPDKLKLELQPGAPSSILPSPSSFSLLRLHPLTGRKHQLRIHLAHLGHPIVGDKIYGGDEDCYLALVENRLTDAQRAKLIFANQALHARAVRFAWHGRDVEFSCDPELWFTAFANDQILKPND